MGKLKKQAKRQAKVDAKRDIECSLAKTVCCYQYIISYSNGVVDYVSCSVEDPFCPWLWAEAVHQDVPDAPMILNVEQYVFRSTGQPYTHFNGCPPVDPSWF